MIRNIENVTALTDGYSSTVRGDNGNNVLSVSSLNDDGRAGVSFYGRGGDDSLTGSAGNDVLSPGTGHDAVNGGSGFDILVLDGAQTSYHTLSRGDMILFTDGDGNSVAANNIEQVQFADGSKV